MMDKPEKLLQHSSYTVQSKCTERITFRTYKNRNMQKLKMNGLSKNYNCTLTCHTFSLLATQIQSLVLISLLK